MTSPRGAPARRASIAGAVLLTLVFLALGAWQIERRGEKLALIERVEARVHAPPVALPPRAGWPQFTTRDDEYRRVRASGGFDDARETLVQAVTELGAGFWVMTPLRLADGGQVIVNRGFVPPERRAPQAHAGGGEGPVEVVGLLRLNEPGGGFLRRNDPAANRWTSRDVVAIGAARGLADVAPFFIDAEAAPPGAPIAGPAAPVAGLTVVAFPNNHAVYAITWVTLALMTAWGAWRIARDERPASSERGDDAVR